MTTQDPVPSSTNLEDDEAAFLTLAQEVVKSIPGRPEPSGRTTDGATDRMAGRLNASMPLVVSTISALLEGELAGAASGAVAERVKLRLQQPDGDGNPTVVRLTGEDRRPVLVEFIGRCLATAFARADAWPPTDDLLLREYRRCRSAWDSDLIEYTVLAPLDGVYLPGWLESLPSIAGMAIRERGEAEDRILAIGGGIQSGVRGRHCVAVLAGMARLPPHASPWEGSRPIIDRVSRVITGLRLATEAPIGARYAVIVPTDQFFQVPGSMNFVQPFTALSINDERSLPMSHLCEKDVQRAASLVDRMTGDTERVLTTGLGRMNWAMSRVAPEDEVLDSTTALESLLVPDSNSDIRYRFSLRGAALMAGRLPVHETHQFLRALYNARNRIVHGGQRLAELKKSDLVGLTPLEFAHKAVATCRAVVRAFVEASPPILQLKAFAESLDDRVVALIAADAAGRSQTAAQQAASVKGEEMG